MKKHTNRIWKNICHMLCICFAIVLLPLQAFASDTIADDLTAESELSLTLHNGAGAGNFSFYKVADFSESGRFDITGTMFADYVGEVENFSNYTLENLDSEGWTALAQTLAGCVEKDSLDASYCKDTDEQGNLVWTEAEGLEKALYLIIGKPIDEENTYTMLPYLITVPNRDTDGNWITQVTVDLTKYIGTTEEFVSRKVMKIWKDTDNESKRPSEITVQLLKDGEVVEEVVLNEENNWEYEWTELDANSEWKVVEKEVPDSYVMSSTQDGKTFVIINTYKEKTPDTPSSGKPSSGSPSSSSSSGGSKTLPKTGQLWWPVPVLVILGIGCLVIGCVRRRDNISE